MGVEKSELIRTPQQALLLACITMLYTDDTIEENKLVLLNQLEKRGIRIPQENELHTIKDFFDTHTLNECIEVITKTINEEEKQTVFLNLLDFALADGTINEVEKQLLSIYASAFQLDTEFTDRAMALMMMKNKPLN